MTARAKKLNTLPATMNDKPLRKPIPARFKKANKLTPKEVTKPVREPDEVLTQLRNAIDDYSGNFPTWNERRITIEIAASAMVNWKTIRNIVSGDTTRPQNYTCDRIFDACGWQRQLIRKAS